MADGETITTTKHGVPAARLVPSDSPRPEVGAVIDELREFRKRENIRLDGISVRELIEEGRRWWGGR